ncbi:MULTISPECIES: polyprenyl synthetase family protein [unclassified Micromonospora]|uniref:polyprenyl synthetase family protein n=1 Tax=unclassified Micromonospora TaxID=2617518 RepID=UPI00124B5D4B|nr:polyprenyl synthetase family protein [Micromonospora sp. ALFpr18c]
MSLTQQNHRIGTDPRLDGARDLVDAGLREAVDGLHPDLGQLASYHFGWSTADGTPISDGSGKLLRATLTLLSTSAVGAEPNTGIPGAIAVEMIHNFSLLHDDIMDADALRRGRPAAWVVFGAGMATLAGDALIATAFEILRSTSSSRGRESADLLLAGLHQMIDGQASDLSLEHVSAADVDADHYLRACAKTTALLEAAAAIGAVLGGARPATVDALRQAGRHLGLSWQMANDVEDIWGDPAATGKPARSDLVRSKKTIPVILALRAGNAAATDLARLVGEQVRQPTAEHLQAQADLIERAGGRRQAEELSARHLTLAIDKLAESDAPEAGRQRMDALFRMILRRQGVSAIAGG